jgi:hypothetical protein
MVEAITQLPDGYSERASIDLKRDYQFVLWMQLWGLLGLGISLVLFWRLMIALRPESRGLFTLIERLPEGGVSIQFPLGLLVGLLASTVLMVVLHEAVHGIFFWLFTSRRPRFGFKIYYAYAATPPGVYLTRRMYFVVGAAPLVLLSIAGVLLLPVVPLWAVPTLYFFLVGNASGSIGDVMVLFWLLRMPAETLVEDLGDAMIAYAPAASA